MNSIGETEYSPSEYDYEYENEDDIYIENIENDSLDGNEEYTSKISLLSSKIKKDMNKNPSQNPTYSFGTVTIDDIKVSIKIKYWNRNIPLYSVDFESIHVFETQYGISNKYILCGKSFTSLIVCLNFIHLVASSYKMKNGKLHSIEKITELDLHKYILPFSENEKCCICYENSREETLCGHYLCFKCRCKCIVKKDNKCPVCRKKDVLEIYYEYDI